MRYARSGASSMLSGCLLMAAAVAGAQDIYRGESADGTPSFSDRPAPGSTRVDLPTPSTYSAPEGVPAPPATAQADAALYDRVEIVTPRRDELFWDGDGPVRVHVRLEPDLAPQHRLYAELNGRLLPEPQRETEFLLADLDPNSYELRVVVRDGHGKPLEASGPVVFHYRKHSLNLPARAGGAP